MSAQPVIAIAPAPPEPAPEELARAGWYALLAALFRAPPDDALLARVAHGADGQDGTPLGVAWNALARASSQARADEVKAEYDTMFLGVGKAEVFLYGSYHLAGFLNERPLAELRTALAELGLARRDGVGETEDHIAALCDAMRHLVAGDAPADVGVQRQFFQRFIAPWYPALCESIEACPNARYYRDAGRLLGRFLDVERQAFDFEV